ncbi:substrate-binding domain-containing protein [bacterium]|nr:substrate-binding domain-containing protein [bacterium]
MVKTLVRHGLFLIVGMVALCGCGGGRKDGAYTVGFSQVTVKEPWRVVFNENLQAKADTYGERLRLITLDANDKTENQVAHIETFIVKKVDGILISPKEASGCSEAIKEAMEAGIPVMVLDRNTTYRDYTAFVGADNGEIGKAAGMYVRDLLGGEGAAAGVVYEICGSLASTPAQERRGGFHAVLDREPGVTIIGGLDGDWKLDRGKAIAQDALQVHDDIDVIYAHNDPMAYGAYQAAKELGKESGIAFIGIDGLPGEGCQWVKNGILKATFLYPTPGEKALELMMDMLEGKRTIERGTSIQLPTATITAENADEHIR